MAVFVALQESLVSMFGSMTYVAIAIILFFLIGFLLTGFDFRFALLIITPLIIVFSSVGWFPKWIGGFAWIIIIGFGLYIAYRMLHEYM
jgi:hypothetical protein